MLKPFQRRCLLASTTYSKGVDASLYYNPSCSKCRNAEALLANRGVEATVVRYLDDPPTPDELTRLMAKLGIEDPRMIMRTSEPVYTELGLVDASAGELLYAIECHPILLERPIFVLENRAVIARPPERLLELL